MTNDTNSPRYLLLGQITRPHGVRGELKMRVMTDYPERLAELEHVYLAERVQDDAPKPYTVRGARMNKGQALLRLDGITDRDTADRLRSLYVLVAVEDAIPLEDGEFYLFQLIGLRVEDASGFVLGTIKDVMETGANDVYVIDSPDYGEVLFPAHDETIIRHNIAGGVVVVNTPDGLLPDKK